MNYEGYKMVLRRNEQTQIIVVRLKELVEEFVGPLAALPDQNRQLILRTIHELTERLLSETLDAALDDESSSVVSPI